MVKRLLRILLPAGVVLWAVVLLRRTVVLRDEIQHLTPSADRWTPLPETAAAEPLAPAVEPRPPAPAWVAANNDGTCPPTHPIKAKEASCIYHLPGMFAYHRTKPDRCYSDEAAAETDGFTRAKR